MPHDNINNRTATTLELAQKRDQSARSLLQYALDKAAVLEPPYSEDIAIRREIQACKDLVRVESQWLSDVQNNIPKPVGPVPGYTTLVFGAGSNPTTGF